MIQVNALRKCYGSLTAVDGVSFEINAGETFGLLGPNGAGKSTTIHMMVGILRPDAGVVTIDGAKDPTRPEVRRRIGLAPQSMSLYEDLTGEENLLFFARLYGLSGAVLKERVARALELSGLTERRKDRVHAYSGGMQRRLNLAVALVHDPAVLFLDEPTAGVDPQSRNHLFESIEALKSAGRTILYTTHYMEEAQRLCDRVAVMDRGRLLALGTVESLIREHGGASVVHAELESVPEDPARLPGPLEGTSFEFQTEEPLQAIARLSTEGLALRSLSVQRPDLERVFLSLTGRTLRD